MTQYPGPSYPAPGAPPGYQPDYGRPAASYRPTPITVLAIFGIIFGGMGLLCKPLGLAVAFMPQPPGANPAMAMQRELLPWNLANAGIGTVISVLLLASAIGSLSLKPWARKGMLAYAGLAVVMSLVTLVVTIVWVVPKMHDMQQQIMLQSGGRGGPPPAQMATIMQAAGTAGAVIAFIIALIFPAFILYLYTRPHIVAAFEGTAPPAGYGAGPYGAPAYGAPQPGYYAGQPPQSPPGSWPPQQG